MNELALNLFYGVFGLAALYYGADFLVRGGVSAARKAGVSPLVIGLTLVAFATSAPELVVSVGAALEGNADISLGNIVGSNICNIALILGLCACITPMSVQRQLLRFDAPIMAASAILLAIFYLISHGLSRQEALVLLSGIIAYTCWSIYASRKETAEKPPEPHAGKTLPLWLAAGLILLGLAALVAGAKTFLWSAVYFARMMNLSDAVIGLTVVAIGTSLPELATSVVAALKGENDIAIGNVLGSNIFNILGILGIAPLIRPLSNASLDMVDLGMMVFCSLILLPLMRTGWKLSRREGSFFLLTYAGYTVYLILHHG